jgi:hypothetical protein
VDFGFVRNQTNQLKERLAEGTIMVDIAEQESTKSRQYPDF